MNISIEPLRRVVWDEMQGGYVETIEVYGYKAVDWQGRILAVGETCEEAHENALSEVGEALGRE